MDINIYQIIVIPKFSRETNRIYEYISEDLHSKKASDNLMIDVEKKVSYLEFSPKIYAEIDKIDDIKRKYRRIPVKNYVLLYTIDEKYKIIYIAHMYYCKRNYMRIK